MPLINGEALGLFIMGCSAEGTIYQFGLAGINRMHISSQLANLMHSAHITKVYMDDMQAPLKINEALMHYKPPHWRHY